MSTTNKVSSRRAIRLSAASCALALCLPGIASAETWQFDPTMDLKFGYDDNIRLREIDDAAQETVVGGSLEVARLSEISETRAYLRGSYIAYSSADDSTLDDADIIQVGFQTKRKLNELSGLQLNLEYILDTVGGSSRIDELNPIDNGVDIIEGVVSDQIDRDRIKVAPRWEMEMSELSKIALDYSYEDVEFGNNSGSFLRDYDWHRFGAEYSYNRTDTTTWKPRVEFVAYESEDGDEVESVQFRLGYEKSLSETSKLWLNIGVHQTELTAIPGEVVDLNGIPIDVGSVETEENGLLFDINYRKNTERTVTSFRLERQLAPSGNGELLETTSLSGTLSGRLKERVSYSIYASYFITEDGFGDGQQIPDRTYSILAPMISYEVKQYWQLGLQYRFRLSDDDSLMDSTESNGVFVTLKYQPSKLAR